MRIERLPEYVTTVTVTLVGIAFALYCGSLTGSGQVQMLIMIFGMLAAVTTLLTLRSAIWVLIPATWALSGTVPSLPIPLSLRDVIIMFVAVAFFLLKALKVVRFKPVYSFVDIVLVANLAYIATVFVRNPVGTYFFESDRVGGRPYLNVAIAFFAYAVLNQAFASPFIARVLPWMMTGSAMIEGFLGIIASKFPVLVPALSRFYGSPSFAPEGVGAAPVPNDSGSGRNITLMHIGPPILAALYSRFRPSTLINPLYIVRFGFTVLAAILVLYSGFRSSVLSGAAGFLIASYFIGGFRSVARLLMVGVFALTLIIMLQGTLFQLPRAAQRALSFLPGQWDAVAVAEAKHSTDWRLYMWVNVLSSDRYIQNKLLGDGFGFSMIEMNILARGNYKQTPEEAQESYMAMGEYHSGPISAIRYVGVVGLLLYTLLLFVLLREAISLIKRCKGGPFQFLSLFVGIPLIYEPFQFFVVYGGYKENIAVSMFSVGMIKMIRNSLEVYEKDLTSHSKVISTSRVIAAYERKSSVAPERIHGVANRL